MASPEEVNMVGKGYAAREEAKRTGKGYIARKEAKTGGTGYYESRFVFDRKRETVWRELCRFLQRYVPEDGTVLDLGAGYCDFINNIRAKGKIAVDINKDFAKHAVRGVRCKVGSVERMGFLKKGSIDAVFASNLLEHLNAAQLRRTIKEVRRVLRKKGKVILIQPNYRLAHREYFDDYTHVSVFSDVSIKDFLKAHGFSIVKCVPRFLPFSMKSRLPKAGFLVNIYLRLPVRPFAKQMLVVAEKTD
jgi:SAM-dependent methyltransferase